MTRRLSRRLSSNSSAAPRHFPDLDAYYEDLDTSDPNPPHHGHSHSHDEPSHGHSHSHEHAAHSHGGEESSSKAKSKIEKVKPTDFDMDKMRSTLKQFVRDWSAMVRSVLTYFLRPPLTPVHSSSRVSPNGMLRTCPCLRLSRSTTRMSPSTRGVIELPFLRLFLYLLTHVPLGPNSRS